jgi:O-antigen/teichoic acid export membrane protein
MGVSTRAALSLTAGRAVGFAAAFAIPVVLARTLTQEEFGVYKYLFLVATTLGCLQLGMAESLYYFVPRARDSAGRHVANALTTLLAIGIAIVAVAFMTPAVVPAATDGVLARYLPWIAIYLAGTLLAAPLEIVMVSRLQYRAAAVTYAVSDLVRAALLIAPGLMLRDALAVLAGAVVFAVLRSAGALLYLARAFGRGLRIDRGLWRSQWAYALPFSVAVIIETAQFNLHQYIVWARFDPATFAIYAAGCLQVPIVDLFAMSVANVLMVRMGERAGHTAPPLDLWHGAVTRLAFVLVPLTAALMVTAPDLIAFVFTPAYLGAVPVFRVSILLILLAALPIDAVLRVHAQTRFLIGMNVMRLAIVAGSIGWALATFHLPGGMAVTVVATAVAKLVALVRVGQLLGARAPHLLPWRHLAGIAAAALLAAIPAVWLHAQMTLPPFGRGALTAVAYGLLYLALLAPFIARRAAVRAATRERAALRAEL